MSHHTGSRVITTADDQKDASPLLAVSLFLLTLPYRRAFRLYTWKPLRDIRAAKGDREVLIPLVKAWKAEKYDELQSVQVAASFCGGAVFSSLPCSRTNHVTWIVDALWLSSLVCSIFAIITSIQTKSMLDDLPTKDELDVSSLPDSEVQRMQRAILRFTKSPGFKYCIMVFVWQFPSMTMAYAWCNFIAGLTVCQCSPFIEHLPWQDSHKVAITYLSFVLVGLITYISTTIFVYMGEKDYERSVTKSPPSTVNNSPATTLTNRSASPDEAETGVAPNEAGVHTKARRNATSSTVVNDARPVQVAREKSVMLGFKDSQANQGKRSRQLLYG